VVVVRLFLKMLMPVVRLQLAVGDPVVPVDAGCV
jgi:hypothetical protein